MRLTHLVERRCIPAMTSSMVSQGGVLFVKRLVIRRRCGKDISYCFEPLMLRKDVCVHVLCVRVNAYFTRGLSLDSKGLLQQLRRTLARL